MTFQPNSFQPNHRRLLQDQVLQHRVNLSKATIHGLLLQTVRDPILGSKNAKEVLVKEFVSRDRLNHLRDAVGYKVPGALLGEYSSLNLIVHGELCGSEFDLAKETSLSLVNALSRLRLEPSSSYP